MLTEFKEIVIHDGLTDLLQEVNQEIEVVITSQANAEGLICLEEVAKISPGVILTSVAITLVI